MDRRVVRNGWLGRRRGTRFIDEIDDEADQGAKEQSGQHDRETSAEPPPPVAQVRPVNWVGHGIGHAQLIAPRGAEGKDSKWRKPQEKQKLGKQKAEIEQRTADH